MNLFPLASGKKSLWQKIFTRRATVQGGNYNGSDRRDYQHFFVGPDRRKRTQDQL